MYPLPLGDSVPCFVSTHELVPEAISRDEWIQAQLVDEFCQTMRKRMDDGVDQQVVLTEDGILARKLPALARPQVLVPESLRPRLLRNYHYSATAGHPGVRRMYDTLRQGLYWPTMVVDVHATVRGCETCARDRMQLSRHTNPLKLFPALRPLEDVAIDLMGPLPKTSRGKLHVLVIMDRYSKLCRLVAMRSIQASLVVKAFVEEWVFTYGAPKTILSDNGPQFRSKTFVDACVILGIKPVTTTTYHPQTNGQVERFNRTLASMLRHYVAEDHRNWDEYLPVLAYAYNRCVHRSTNTIPFELVLTRAPPPIGLEDIKLKGDEAWTRDSWRRQLRGLYARANSSLARMQARYKRDFDKAVRAPNRRIRAGDAVYIDLRNTSQETTILGRARNKLDFQSMGPYTVISNQGHTFDILVDGIPERISSDRVRPAPGHGPVQPGSDGEEEGRETANARSRLPRRPRANEVQTEPGSEALLPADRAVPPSGNTVSDPRNPQGSTPAPIVREDYPRVTQDASELVSPTPVDGDSEEHSKEYTIDDLIEEWVDDDGVSYFRVRWLGYAPEEDTWEPEANLPPAIVARHRKRTARQKERARFKRPSHSRKVRISLIHGVRWI